MRSSRPYDAIVIGGGLVGLSTAYHLVSQGAKTLLFDRADRGRATTAGAGILAPEANIRDSDQWYRFALQAVGYYPELVARLEEEQAGETGYGRCGKLLVAMDEAELPAFDALVTKVQDRHRRLAGPDAPAITLVDPEEAHAWFPPLAPVKKALYFPNAARVDGRLLSASLQRAAAQKGLAVQPGSVEALVMDGDRVLGVHTSSGDRYDAGAVVIAGGAWSQTFSRQLGMAIPVEPQRGQILHLRLPGVNTGGWPIVGVLSDHYLVSFSDSRVVVGATREDGSGFLPRITAAGMYEVLDVGLRLAPGLAAGHLLEMRVGLRPMSRDRLPILGATPGIQGVFLATGHGPTGLQLGPFSGKVVAQQILGQPLDAAIDQFSIQRFLDGA